VARAMAGMVAAANAALRKRALKNGPPPGIHWKIYKAFMRIDKDSSNLLEAEEFVVCLDELGRGMTEKQASRLIAECGPLVNEGKYINDDGKCFAVDLVGFQTMYLEIEKYKPSEPFLKYSILGNRPLPYQAKVREAYCNPIVVWTVATVIIGNFIVNILEKEYDPDPKELKYAELWISFDTAFNAIFLVELTWNMYGFGFGKRFWYSGWNVFDFIITGVGVVLLAGVTGPISQLKLLRAFRVFRLFKRIKSLNKIVVALIAAVPGVSNAFAILFIFYCIYAILAVELFRDFGINGTYMTDDLGSIRHVVDSTTPRGYTHGIEYYGTYSRAMYTLFEIMTGDSNFEALARPLTFGLYQRSAFTVSFFFVSFIILTSMVMSNVVVAVLLDQFVAPPPAGLTDNEVTLFIDYLKEELSTKKSLEGIDANPIEGLGDDALSKLIERMEQRTERTEQYILRLEGKLDQLVNSSSHPEPPGPAAGGGGTALKNASWFGGRSDHNGSTPPSTRSQ